jgi:NitT/TauT family transport system ATP-binding protein
VLTPSPTRVLEILDVELSHPRDQVTTKELGDFTRLRGHVWRSIKRPDEAGDVAEAPATAGAS